MKVRLSFRFKLILAILLLVVTPILITGFVAMQTAGQALNRPEDFEVNRLRETIVYMLVIGTVISLTGAAIFSTGLADSVNIIRRGLEDLGRDMDISLPPLRGMMGEIAGSINQLAQNLRETRSHRDALLLSSPNGIITVERDRSIILFNPAAAELTGIRADLALGSDFSRTGFDPWLVELFGRVLSEGKVISASEHEISGATPRSVAVSASPLQNAKGQIMGALAVIIDLKEKRLLEAQVLQANRLAGLGELAAGIAHEIRNPLTAVKGFAQVMEEELAPADEKREYTRIIVREAERMEGLVRGLLDFAKPVSSKFRLEDLEEIMEETLVLVNTGSFKRRITIERLYSGDVRAEVDREQLKQVFLNLLLNAGQAVEGRGTVKIASGRMADRPGEVFVSVADSGSGISREHLEKLFDPFFSTREKGTGLGLTMVHRLVELHHGRVMISSSEGSGSEFRVILPVSQGGVNYERQQRKDLDC